MSSEDHFNDVQRAVSEFLELTDQDFQNYQARHKNKKLTQQSFAKLKGVSLSTFNSALATGRRNNGEISRGNGPPTLFSGLEELTLMAYIKTMADHNEPLTIREFLDYASEMFKRLYPLKQKKTTTNKRSCNYKSGHVEFSQYGKLSRFWLKGFRRRIQKVYGVTYSMRKPEYLEATRAAVTLKDLESNFAEFRDLCTANSIDLTTSEGRRRVGNGDESGISGGKDSSKTSNEKVMMPSNGPARPTRKVIPNRGHITNLSGASMSNEVHPTLFIDKPTAKKYHRLIRKLNKVPVIVMTIAIAKTQ